jgi:hypothetical protein
VVGGWTGLNTASTADPPSTGVAECTWSKVHGSTH